MQVQIQTKQINKVKNAHVQGGIHDYALNLLICVKRKFYRAIGQMITLIRMDGKTW